MTQKAAENFFCKILRSFYIMSYSSLLLWSAKETAFIARQEERQTALFP